MDLPVTADSRMDAIINAPCESIDLTAWVFVRANFRCEARRQSRSFRPRRRTDEQTSVVAAVY